MEYTCNPLSRSLTIPLFDNEDHHPSGNGLANLLPITPKIATSFLLKFSQTSSPQFLDSKSMSWCIKQTYGYIAFDKPVLYIWNIDFESILLSK